MMKPQSPCHRCFQRQAVEAARRAGLDADALTTLQGELEIELKDAEVQGISPPLTASHLHQRVRELSGNPDPYLAAKREATEHALALYPHLQQLIADSAQPLQTALRLAIAGNIIDLGVAAEYDLEASIERVLRITPAIDHSARLLQALASSNTLLYLADNAGETVMDRLLIETLHAHFELEVTYVVKSGPTVNDATGEDAREAGLEGCSTITDNGAAAMGTLRELCSDTFHQRFDAAPLIIAKGMANYESLVGSRAGLFFLLQTKCSVVAEHLGVVERSIILLEDAPA